MNLRLFPHRDPKQGGWFIRGFGYGGYGDTPEEALRDLVRARNTSEPEQWPVALSRVPQWQPMDSAPRKNFTRILVSDGTLVREAYWSQGPLDNGHWSIDGNGSFVGAKFWSPMPTPPDQEPAR